MQADLENGLFQPGSVRRGLASSSCVSFESRKFPGDFLRHSNFQLFRQPMDGTALFRADATFCPQAGQGGQGTSFASYNYPTRFKSALQQHRLHRQQRRHERVGFRHLVGGRRELGRQSTLGSVALHVLRDHA